MSNYSLRSKSGFTLIELVITIIILGMSSLILIPFFNTISHSSDPVIRQKSVALGQAMIDEIMGKRWDENTPVGGWPIVTAESPVTTVRGGTPLPAAPTATSPIATEEGAGNRADFDDIDDYNGLIETDDFEDQLENSFTWNGYSRTVSVDYIDSSEATIDENTAVAAGTTDSKRVTVTVTNPLQETFVLVAVFCNI